MENIKLFGRRPVSEDFLITLKFGEKYAAETVRKLKLKHKEHPGTDFGTVIGTPASAWKDGLVVRAEEVNSPTNTSPAWGNWIAIYSDLPKLNEAVIHYYCHLKFIQAQKGLKVKEGELIGYTGDSGACTAAHLHFETRFTPSNVAFEPFFI